MTVPDHEVITRRKQFRMKRDVADQKKEKRQEKKKENEEKKKAKEERKMLREKKRHEKNAAEPKKRGRKPKQVGEANAMPEKKVQKQASTAKASKQRDAGDQCHGKASGSAARRVPKSRSMKRLQKMSPRKKIAANDGNLGATTKTKKRKQMKEQVEGGDDAHAVKVSVEELGKDAESGMVEDQEEKGKDENEAAAAPKAWGPGRGWGRTCPPARSRELSSGTHRLG